MTEHGVQDQYERFPYPPIPFIALPRRKEGQELRYEKGCQLAFGKPVSHRGIRILVAGAGTLEPLVVAQMHPLAREIVAVDLSQRSLKLLKRRIQLARTLRFYQKLPPIRLIQANLMDPATLEGAFDYIIASNVIHHVSKPAELLGKLSQKLVTEGIFRVVTYPKASRVWMRETGKWLRAQGLSASTPKLKQKVEEALSSLPFAHPFRRCFESCSEKATTTGIVDAFFHCLENPLNPLEWEKAVDQSGLTCVGETQNEMSRSSFLDEIVPALSSLSRWQKLQILDNLLELCANPIFWFKKISSEKPVPQLLEPQADEEVTGDLRTYEGNKLTFRDGKEVWLPSPIRSELRKNLEEIRRLIAPTGVTLEELLNQFRNQVGPRVNGLPPHQELRGLALSDYLIS